MNPRLLGRCRGVCCETDSWIRWDVETAMLKKKNNNNKKNSLLTYKNRVGRCWPTSHSGIVPVNALLPKSLSVLFGFNLQVSILQPRATRAQSRWDTYTWRSFLKCFKSVGIVPRRMFLADLYCYGRFFGNETGSWTIEETVLQYAHICATPMRNFW